MGHERIAPVVKPSREGPPGPARFTQVPRGKIDTSRGEGVHMFVHMFLSRTIFPQSNSLHLHSILPFYSTLTHPSSPKPMPPASCRPPPPSSIAVVRLEMDLSLSPPPLYPTLTTPPLFLSPSSYVRSRERMDSGSVFIGSVFSTSCSRAPLRGWGMGDQRCTEKGE